jgi:outer membrane immunogenic protein
MRRFAILFAALSFSGPAFAADMATKMPANAPPPPAPVYSWTGFYVGGNIGGGWTSGWNSTYSPLPSPAAFGGAPGSLSMNASGIVGGVQGGYNWQFTNWVAGVEGDFTWTHLNANAASQSLTFPGLAPIPGEFQTMNRTVNWLASARGRIGYAWDRTFLYVTGGPALGQMAYTANKNVLAGGGFSFPASFSSTQPGWVAGGGVEQALSGAWSKWTVRAEYLYYGFGGQSVVVPQVPATAFTRAYTWSDANLQVVRAALNYRF